jgi:two-component system chemotaxis response regulator CheY
MTTSDQHTDPAADPAVDSAVDTAVVENRSAALAAEGDDARFGQAGSPAARPHRCDVLIADDSGPSREILSAILRNFVRGLKLTEARNGVDALESWKELNPRITMLDLDMPGMDGLAALQRIRAADPGAFVAIVSGRSSSDNVRQSLELGANGFVVKPYKPQRILDVLQRYATLKGTTLGC